MSSIMYATSDDIADKYPTCEYCDRLVSSPNFAYHVCTGRKVYKGKKAAQQSVKRTANESGEEITAEDEAPYFAEEHS